MPSQTISYTIGDRLYLNITDRCTLQCAFCPKHNGSNRVHAYDLTLDHRPSPEEIIAAIDDPADYSEVVFCGYGEPTLRLKVLLTTARHIKAHGGRVRVNTDGLANLFHKRNVLPEMSPCVDALSVSMNVQHPCMPVTACPPCPGRSRQCWIFSPRPRVTSTTSRRPQSTDWKGWISRPAARWPRPEA